MKIAEIQRAKSHPKDDSIGANEKIPPPANAKPIPGTTNLAYTVGNAGANFSGATMKIVLWDLVGKDLIGWLGLKPSNFPLPKSVQVANVKLSSKYRGQGLGQSLYGVATKILGYTIVSDETQTSEASRMWVNLHGVPGMEIMGWLSIPRNYIDMSIANDWTAPEIKRYQTMVAKLQGRPKDQAPEPLAPMQDVDTYSSVYYGFPVTSGPDGRELQAANKVVAIYTKDHPEDSHRAIDTGLYARWKK